MIEADKVQVNTVRDNGTDICSLVKADLEKRALLGFKKYGERLRTNNGRDALLDAYQEALDLTMYLRQELERRQWIKLSDEKPECSGIYLATNGTSILICGYFAGKKSEWCSLESERGFHPTHWTPLPQPPEEAPK